jgi:hypothetical protein
MSKTLSKAQKHKVWYEENKHNVAKRVKQYTATKRGHLSKYMTGAKQRAKNKNLPFDITLDFLESIATDCCPVFKTPFKWGLSGRGQNENNPSLDRVIPELGYVQGNVVFISNRANSIKQDVTEKELYAVADWLHDKRKEVLNAQKRTNARLSKTNGGKSKTAAKHGSVHGAGVGQDCDGSHHHIGEC